MSMELLILFTLKAPPSAQEWQSAMTRNGVPIQITELLDLNEHEGFLPLTYDSKKSGFYLGHLDYDEIDTDYPEMALSDVEVSAVYSLGFGGNFMECASVFHSASTLISDFGARAFDTESLSFLDGKDLLANATKCLELAQEQ
ncbi:MAG: hypothetical protein ABL989_13325 [Gammaproteobacteria bacterium]